MGTAIALRLLPSLPAKGSTKRTWLNRILELRTAAADARIADYFANLPEATRDRIDPELRRRLKR